MKQLEFTEKKIGENTFYIRPLPAFKAAGISGDLVGILAPLLSALATLNDTEDTDLAKTVPAISELFSGLSSDKLERVLKKLLTENGNVSYETPEMSTAKKLTENDANEIFSGEVQNLFILAAFVIGSNYRDFFGNAASQFGDVFGRLKEAAALRNTANSTQDGSTLSN